MTSPCISSRAGACTCAWARAPQQDPRPRAAQKVLNWVRVRTTQAAVEVNDLLSSDICVLACTCFHQTRQQLHLNRSFLSMCPTCPTCLCLQCPSPCPVCEPSALWRRWPSPTSRSQSLCLDSSFLALCRRVVHILRSCLNHLQRASSSPAEDCLLPSYCLKIRSFTVSLGDNFFTPPGSILLSSSLPRTSSNISFLSSSSSLLPSPFWPCSKSSPLLTVRFSFKECGLKEDTSLGKILNYRSRWYSPSKTSPVGGHLWSCIELWDDVHNGPGKEWVLNKTILIAMMTIMMILLTRDLVAGNWCGAWEPLMSAIDLFAQVGGRAPLLLARCWGENMSAWCCWIFLRILRLPDPKCDKNMDMKTTQSISFSNWLTTFPTHAPRVVTITTIRCHFDFNQLPAAIKQLPNK